MTGYQPNPPLNDSTLAHFGVKGMRWGHRKNTAAAIKKQMSRIDTNDAFSGYELRGWGIKKQYKKEIRKNPKFAYGKLTPEQKRVYETKAANRVKHTLMRRGIFEVGVILAGGNLLVNSAKVDADSARGAKIAVGVLAFQAGKVRISEISSVNKSIKLDDLRDQLKALEKAPRK